ncbi:hypothetical protein ThrDRAFT_04058, partial [Frankia casuarinae]
MSDLTGKSDLTLKAVFVDALDRFGARPA